MLGQPVLMLAFGDAHVMLDVEIGEEFFESVTSAFACAIGVEDAKALRALALGKVVIDSLGIDTVLLEYIRCTLCCVDSESGLSKFQTHIFEIQKNENSTNQGITTN